MVLVCVTAKRQGKGKAVFEESLRPMARQSQDKAQSRRVGKNVHAEPGALLPCPYRGGLHGDGWLCILQALGNDLVMAKEGLAGCEFTARGLDAQAAGG
jgi:hypothetical protein